MLPIVLILGKLSLSRVFLILGTDLTGAIRHLKAPRIQLWSVRVRLVDGLMLLLSLITKLVLPLTSLHALVVKLVSPRSGSLGFPHLIDGRVERRLRLLQ